MSLEDEEVVGTRGFLLDEDSGENERFHESEHLVHKLLLDVVRLAVVILLH